MEDPAYFFSIFYIFPEKRGLLSKKGGGLFCDPVSLEKDAFEFPECIKRFLFVTKRQLCLLVYLWEWTESVNGLRERSLLVGKQHNGSPRVPNVTHFFFIFNFL